MNVFIRAVGTVLHNKPYTLDGIEGVITYQEWSCIYPYPSIRQHILHTANEIRQQHPDYVTVRKQLGDDFSTDLTYSEQLIGILYSINPTFLEVTHDNQSK